MSKSIGIVGAGPGGLAAAMLLAQAGARVTLYERQERVGGRSASLSCTAEPGTFHFDTGPTFFLYPRVLQDVFAACGMTLADEIEMIRLDPQYKLTFEQTGDQTGDQAGQPGAAITAWSDMSRLAEEVARLSPADAAALPRFMADNRAKLAAFRPVLESAMHGLRSLATGPMIKSLPLLRPHRTVDSDLATYFKDPRVRLAFSFQSKYLGMSPFRCPSLFTILAFMEYEYGVYHPRGGCGALMQMMADRARDLGVDIRLAEPVEAMEFAGRRVTGIQTRRGLTRHDAVVINADFANTMRSLVPDALRRRWTDGKLAGKKFSCSTFMLYLGLEGTYDELPHHSIFLSEDYRRNIAEIEAGAAPADPSFYVQNASVSDRTLAPPGHSTLYMLIPVGNRQPGGQTVDWSVERPRYRRLAIDRLQKLGLHDVERRIRTEVVRTPTDWEDEHGIHRGATFNLAHNLGQMLHNRPRNRFEDLDGVYLVGGGTHPGSGLPVIFESARITARLLVDDLGISAQWQAGSRMAEPDYVPVLAEAS